MKSSIASVTRVELDGDLGVLVGGHPCSQSQPARQREQEPHPAEKVSDPLTGILSGETVRNGAVHGYHPGTRFGFRSAQCTASRSVGPADEQRPVHADRVEDCVEVTQARL